MKDKMTIEYTDSDFSQAIEERFFSGDRLAQFPFMNAERQALWLLWDAKEIKFFGYRYDSRWIRRNMMENLTPDMLDFALRCARIVHPRALAKMLFFFLITGEEMAARHARGKFTKQNFTECYERFRNESEFQLTNSDTNGGTHMRYNTTKRDPIKNSFIMPNEIFRLGLSEGAIAVYAYLLYCEDRGTYQCYPSYTTIAGAIGKSKNSIRKYVAELAAKRLIETEHTTVILKDGRKHNGSLKYTILPIDKAVRYHEEVQMRKLKIEEARREAEKRIAEYDRKHPKTETV